MVRLAEFTHGTEKSIANSVWRRLARTANVGELSGEGERPSAMSLPIDLYEFSRTSSHAILEELATDVRPPERQHLQIYDESGKAIGFSRLSGAGKSETPVVDETLIAPKVAQQIQDALDLLGREEAGEEVKAVMLVIPELHLIALALLREFPSIVIADARVDGAPTGQILSVQDFEQFLASAPAALTFTVDP